VAVKPLALLPSPIRLWPWLLTGGPKVSTTTSGENGAGALSPAMIVFLRLRALPLSPAMPPASLSAELPLTVQLGKARLPADWLWIAPPRPVPRPLVIAELPLRVELSRTSVPTLVFRIPPPTLAELPLRVEPVTLAEPLL